MLQLGFNCNIKGDDPGHLGLGVAGQESLHGQAEGAFTCEASQRPPPFPLPTHTHTYAHTIQTHITTRIPTHVHASVRPETHPQTTRWHPRCARREQLREKFMRQNRLTFSAIERWIFPQEICPQKCARPPPPPPPPRGRGV